MDCLRQADAETRRDDALAGIGWEEAVTYWKGVYMRSV